MACLHDPMLFFVVGFDQLQVCIHPLNKYDIKYCLKKLMLQFRLKKNQILEKTTGSINSLPYKNGFRFD